jgi:GT2 family glycosyltransferase
MTRIRRIAPFAPYNPALLPPQASMSASVCASIVVYESDPALLARTLRSLDEALATAHRAGVVAASVVVLIDNGAPRTGDAADAAETPYAPSFARTSPAAWSRIAGQGNVGYGRGHNLALSRHDADFFLVLNPDAWLADDALVAGIHHLDANAACGLVAPYASGPDGQPQFLCKRYPDALTLALRALSARWARRRFPRRMNRYEMRDVVGADAANPATAVLLASGCCMLLRRDVVRRTGGFDPRFFVYFEDYDLSLRLATGGAARIDYVPAMRIVHHGGNAARKSFAHIRLFATGAFRFFNKHGWKLA